MKVLIPASIRQHPYIPSGSSFFILDHDTVRKKVDFVLCTVAEIGEGAFNFNSSRPLSWGHTAGSIGQSQPNIVSVEEMAWLKAVLARLGTSSYKRLTSAAQDGDMDAVIIVGYCEYATQFVLCLRLRDRDCSTFEPEQFIAAAARCEI